MFEKYARRDGCLVEASFLRVFGQGVSRLLVVVVLLVGTRHEGTDLVASASMIIIIIIDHIE